MSASGVVLERGALLSQHEERDYNHATDSEFKRLRELADNAYKKRQQLAQQSQQAYKQGDGGKAHQLSEQAKVQAKVAEQYNRQAAEYVFTENNADSGSDEIDLHGLYVKEAQWILQKRIAAGVKNGEGALKVIVGKGLHSANGVAKIKPAVEELCDQAHLRNYIDQKNAGVLVVELQGAQIPSSWDTTDYSSYASNAPSKPQNSYQGQQQQGQNYYGQQQQPQYQQQPQQQQQQQNNGNNQNNDIVSTILGLLCQCIQKKM